MPPNSNLWETTFRHQNVQEIPCLISKITFPPRRGETAICHSKLLCLGTENRLPLRRSLQHQFPSSQKFKGSSWDGGLGKWILQTSLEKDKYQNSPSSLFSYSWLFRGSWVSSHSWDLSMERKTRVRPLPHHCKRPMVTSNHLPTFVKL